MNCLVGGPLLVGGLGPGPPAPPLKSGPGFSHRGVYAQAATAVSSQRGNVLSVGNYCYVAV